MDGYAVVPSGLAEDEATVAWLLEPSNPCVRWRTLRELLERPQDDPEVSTAAADVLAWPPVRRILEMLSDPEAFAWPEGIRLTAAQPARDLATLARIGVPDGRPEAARAAGFLRSRLPDNRSSDCYLPQMVAALVRYGDPDDPELSDLVNKVIANETLADGNRPPTGGGGSCCASHSCHNAVVRALDCVAATPERLRPDGAAEFLARGAEYIAAHRLFQRNHHRFAPIRSEYLKLHQPWALDWLTDVVDALDVATRVGLADSPALVPALRFVLGKRQPDGRWPLEARYAGNRPLIANLLSDAEAVGAPGKWVTLTALLLLKRCAGLVSRITEGEVFPEPLAQRNQGFVSYRWADDSADEDRTRADWALLPGMTDVLDGLVAFARRQGLRIGWHRGFAMGPADCREWCCSQAKRIPARTFKAAFPVARTTFLAPRGMFTTDGLCDRLRVARHHSYAGRVKPGSWVEKTLWHVRVEHWTPCWDTVGVAVAEVSEVESVLGVMEEALLGARRRLGPDQRG